MANLNTMARNTEAWRNVLSQQEAIPVVQKDRFLLCTAALYTMDDESELTIPNCAASLSAAML